MLTHLRQMELLGLPDECPLVGDIMQAMEDAGSAYEKRTGKALSCN